MNSSVFRCCLILFSYFIVFSAQSAVKTWDGDAQDGLWSTAENWNGNTLPVSSDTIVIDGGYGDIYLDISFTIQEKLEIKAVEGEKTTLIVNSDATLTLMGISSFRGAVVVNGAGSALINYGNIIGEENALGIALINNATFINNNSLDSKVNRFTLNIDNGAVFNADAINNIHITGNDALIVNDGLIDHASIVLANQNAFQLLDNNSEGVIKITPDSRHDNSVFGPSMIINNHGNIVNASSIRNEGEFNNVESFDNTAGKFENSCLLNYQPGEFINSGTFIGEPVIDDCVIWDNDSGNSLWSDPVNWSTNTLPKPENKIIIDGEDGQDTIVNIDSNIIVSDTLLIGNKDSGHSHSAVNVSKGVHLKMGGMLSLQPNSIMNNYGDVLNQGVLTAFSKIRAIRLNNLGTLTNEGSISFYSTVKYLNGNLVLNNSGTIENSGDINLNCKTEFVNTGTTIGNPVLGICEQLEFNSSPEIIALTSVDQLEMAINEVSLFAVGSANVAKSGNVTVSVNDNGLGLPVKLLICQTDESGACSSPVSSKVNLDYLGNSLASFAIFVIPHGPIVNDMTNHRIYIHFADNSGNLKGVTSTSIYVH